MMIDESRSKISEVRASIKNVPLAEALSPLDDTTPLETIGVIGQAILGLSEPFKALEAGRLSIKSVEDKAKEGQDKLLEVAGVGSSIPIQEAVNALSVMATESGQYGEQMELMKDKLKGAVTHLASAMGVLGECHDAWHRVAGHMEMLGHAQTALLGV